jgi:hypothetical protein
MAVGGSGVIVDGTKVAVGGSEVGRAAAASAIEISGAGVGDLDASLASAHPARAAARSIISAATGRSAVTLSISST